MDQRTNHPQKRAFWALIALTVTASVASGCNADDADVLPLRHRSGTPSVSPSPAPRLSPTADRTPDDPRFSTQANLRNAQAPQAWGLQTDCRQVRVAVLDTGIDLSHPDLVDNLWSNPLETGGSGRDGDGNGHAADVHGWNFVGSNANTQDDNMHGTHVAGIVGASGNNTQGISGICWTASLVPIKAFDADGDGFNSDIIDGLDYAAQMNFRVINASFGTSSYSKTMELLLNELSDEGFLVVAAAGNDASNNDSTASYPASYNSPNIISVAALSSGTGKLASYSNFGQTVDIAAPGSSVYSTLPTQTTPMMTKEYRGANYDYLSGTSMASPHVAAAAALLWSYDTSLNMLEVRSRLLDKADVATTLNNQVSGNRVLNLRKVLE